MANEMNRIVAQLVDSVVGTTGSNILREKEREKMKILRKKTRALLLIKSSDSTKQVKILDARVKHIYLGPKPQRPG